MTHVLILSHTILPSSQVELVGSAEEAKAAPFSDTLAAAGQGSTSASSSTDGGSGSALKGDVTIGVSRASGTKCARCWNFSTRVGENATYPDACERCTPVLISMDFKPPAPAAAAQPAAAGKEPVGAKA